MDTMNKCDTHELLMAYLYDEATAAERLRVETHLAGCAACAQELEGFKRVRGVLQHWQLDDAPVLRVVENRGERSLLAALKELLSVTPLWAKALGAVATAMLVLAVLGTDVKVGRDGVSLRVDLLRSNRMVNNSTSIGTPSRDQAGIDQIRSEVKLLVNQLIADSERQQREDLKAQLMSLQSQLQNEHSADFARIATRIQAQRDKLKTIEQDIDRREGLDLTDILFSEVTKPAERSASGGGD